MDNPTKEKITSLVDYFRLHPSIIHHVKVLGNWDFEPEFEVFSEGQFQEELQKLKDKFSEIIRQIDIITIFKEHKFVYF